MTEPLHLPPRATSAESHGNTFAGRNGLPRGFESPARQMCAQGLTRSPARRFESAPTSKPFTPPRRPSRPTPPTQVEAEMHELSMERMALNAQAARRVGDIRTAEYWEERVEQANLAQQRTARDEWLALVDNRHG